MNASIDPSPSPSPTAGGALFARQMATSLHEQALGFGAAPFEALSAQGARRLSFVCNGFAALIEEGEDTPDAGMSLRSRACFLVSAVASLRAAEGSPPLAAGYEAWMLAEVEHEFGQAISLLESRTGRPHAPSPPRPALPSGAWA